MTRKQYLSEEFKRFIQQEEVKKSWYELLCEKAGNIIRIEPGEDTSKDLKSKLIFCNLKLEPTEVYSTFVLLIILTSLLAFLLSASYIFLGLGAMDGLIPYLLLLLIVGLGSSYYVLIYPKQLAKKIRIQASSELILAVLYMAIGLKNTPNLETATAFAAMNIKGPLGKDLRKLLWDVNTGKYKTIDEGLHVFVNKWKEENDEFTEAIDLLKTSLTRTGIQRDKTIDRAVELILESNMERMKQYARELKNPISIIHALGMLLPVITLILFPIIAVFLPDVIEPYTLVLIYDIALPITVFWFMQNVLAKKPYGFPVIDIKEHPDASQSGIFVLNVQNKKVRLPLLPISLILIALISSPAIYTLLGATLETPLTDRLFAGLLIFWSIVIGIIFFTFLSSNKNRKIKKEVQEIEKDFVEATFLLGVSLSSGQPLEACLEKVSRRIKGQKISGLFKQLLYVIKQFGATLKDAVFNKSYGVIKEYPSSLIQNVLKIMVESSRKGLGVTASILVTVSNYLRDINRVDEYLKELLEETSSSMKLLTSVLVPLACGIVVGMSSILIMILLFVADLFTTMPVSEEVGSVPFLGTFAMEDVMPVEVFLIVVGVYMISTLVTLSVFIVRLEHGDDWVEMQYLISNNLLKGAAIFTFVLLMVHFVFGAMIPLG